MVRTIFDDMLETNPRPQKRFRKLTDEELQSLKKESLSPFGTPSKTHAPKPPRGRKRARDAGEARDSSARKRRAPVRSSPVGTPDAAPSRKRRKRDDVDTDVEMHDAAQQPGLSTPVSASARKPSRRKKSVKDVLRDNRRRGAPSSSSAYAQQLNPNPTPTTRASTPSTSTYYSCQQPQFYESSTDYPNHHQQSYCNDASSTIHTNAQHTWTASDENIAYKAPATDCNSGDPTSDFYTDEICELDVSTGAYDKKPEETSDSHSGAPDDPSLEYLFSSNNQLLLNIKYGASRRVGVVVDIPPF